MLKPRKIAGVLASVGVGVSLTGAGVYATMTDGASAVQNISVSKLACTLSSTDPNVAITSNGHTATLNWSEIDASAASSDLSNLTVNNTGGIAEVVHWTEATGGTIAWQPSGRMGYTLGTPAIATDVTLAPGVSQPYTSLGLSWNTLSNADLGQSASVAYTANCGEVSPPLNSPLSLEAPIEPRW